MTKEKTFADKMKKVVCIPKNEYEDCRRKKEQLLKVKVLIAEAMRTLSQLK